MPIAFRNDGAPENSGFLLKTEASFSVDDGNDTIRYAACFSYRLPEDDVLPWGSRSPSLKVN